MHGYVLSTSGRFRFYLQLIASRDNQETSLGAGVLDSRTQEPVDEFFENHLARKCLRGFNHCREIEMFDRRFDRARWHLRALVLPQMRIELIKLPHLSVGAPSQVAVAGVTQIGVCDLGEITCSVEAGGKLVGKRFVLDETACACRRDGTLVQVHGVKRPSLNAGDLGSDQRGTIVEILWTIRRPGPKLSLMPSKCFSMLGVRVGTDGLAPSGAR